MFLDYNASFLALGHQVTAIVSKGASLIPYIQAQHVPILQTSLISSPFYRYFLGAYRLRKQFLLLKPDIIFVHNARTLALIQRAAKNICPVVTVHHGGNVKRLALAQHIICVARYMQQDLKQHPHVTPSIFYLPNSITIDRPPPASEQSLHNPLRIGFIGRFSYEKGIDILFDAVKALPIPYHLFLAGNGPLKENLITLAEEYAINASFLGWVEGARKDLFFHDIDVLVVPSRHEPFGLVVLEAWLHGVPVIAAAIDGPKELIQPNINGLLFNLNTPKELEMLLSSLRQYPLNTLRQNGYNTLQQDYSKAHFSTLLAQTITHIVTSR